MNDQIDKIIYDALEEDIPTIDIATDILFHDEQTEAVLVAKEDGIISGISVMKRVLQILDDEIYIKIINHDGSFVEENDIIAIISGRLKTLLKGEKIVLNIIQRMSGIATLTKKYVDAVDFTDTKILDTRNTTPNFRILEKQAVLHGGGNNHSMNLSNQAVVTKMHIKEAGGVKNAVSIIKNKIDHTIKIEVSVTSFEEFLDAIHSDCDIINLVDLKKDVLTKCVEYNKGKLLIANNDVNVTSIKDIADTGVDFINVEAITSCYPSFKVDLKYNK